MNVTCSQLLAGVYKCIYQNPSIAPAKTRKGNFYLLTSMTYLENLGLSGRVSCDVAKDQVLDKLSVNAANLKASVSSKPKNKEKVLSKNKTLGVSAFRLTFGSVSEYALVSGFLKRSLMLYLLFSQKKQYICIDVHDIH